MRNTLIGLCVWVATFFILIILINNEVAFTNQIDYRLFLSVILIITSKLFYDFVIKYLFSKGFGTLKVIIVGYSKNGIAIKDYIVNNRWTGYRFIGFVHKEIISTEDYLSQNYENLPEIIKKYNIDEVFLNIEALNNDERTIIQNRINPNITRINLISDPKDFTPYYREVKRYDQQPVLSIGREKFLFVINLFFKRIFDVFGSVLFLLIIGWWLFPIISILIKLDSGGPVFFIQTRTGQNNKAFRCLKFRTMKSTCVKNPSFTTNKQSELEITFIGKFLRKSSLDETPQFINVLKGEMSIVGPRPHMLEHTETFSRQIPSYLNRLQFKPGLTGLAQIRGLRGETKDLEQMKSRVEMDIYYIGHWSFFLDVKIIFISLIQIITGKMIGT